MMYFRKLNSWALRHFFLCIGVLFTPLISKATHLVGGEMTYTCLGNNTYEIQLVIYRDCGPTNTNGTGFDFIGDVFLIIDI